MNTMKKFSAFFCVFLLLFGVVGAANATLTDCGTDNGNHLLCDEGNEIVWYDYTNGPACWDTQVDWADDLIITFGGCTYEDWRLPTCDEYNSLCSDNCLSSFNNVQPGDYWTSECTCGSAYICCLPKPSGGECGTNSVNFSTCCSDKDTLCCALAVCCCDCAPIPEPATIFLLGSGLISLAGFRKKFRK